MGSATREQRLAAIAAVLGVGAAMCNRDGEPTAFPVQAKEVPSAAPDPSATVAVDAAAVVAEVPDAAATVAPTPDAAPVPSARPLPPPPLATPLAAFDRFTPPAARPPGPSPAPPVRPPQHCCSTSALCSVGGCRPGGVGDVNAGPYLSFRATVGLKPKAGIDPEIAQRATRWIARAQAISGGCASMSDNANDQKGGTLSIEVHAGSGATRIEFEATSATFSALVKSCITQRFPRIEGGLVIDGPPAKLVFPIVVESKWIKPGAGIGDVNGGGGATGP
jgi:hypothetical protein